MKLSEAIRLGATLRPQGFNYSFSDGRTCAIGAALEALGRLSERELVSFPRGVSLRSLGWLFTKYYSCPCGEYHDRMGMAMMIQHLNDTHRWSREKIADWVELQEPIALIESEVMTKETTVIASSI